MTRRFGIFIAIAVLILSTLACSFPLGTTDQPSVESTQANIDQPAENQDSSPDLQTLTARTEAPLTPLTQTIVPGGGASSSSAGGGSAASASLTVVNNSGQTIFYLYFSPSSSASWGDDRLGSSTIPAGGSFTFSGITPGTYDIKAENSSHTVIQTWFAVNLSGSTTWTVTGSGGGGSSTASLNVVNNSGQVIFYLYISPSSSASWGDDRLGSSTIPAGGSFTFTGITPGTYDIKAENSSHTVIQTWFAVNLSGSTTWTVTGSGGGGGGTATLTVINNSGTTIFYLYYSLSSSSSWGSDRLGSSTIPAGGSLTFSGIAPGTYDIKAEDSSHNVIQTWFAVNISGPITWTVTGSGGGGGGGTATLTVVNNSGTTIFYLYYSLSSSSSWGNDRLGSSTIPAGGNFTFTGITPGTYDIKAEDSSHNVIRTWFNANLTGPITWTVTP